MLRGSKFLSMLVVEQGCLRMGMRQSCDCVSLSDDGFGTVEARGEWPHPGEGVGTAATFLTRTKEASAAVLRVWRQAKGSCWALPSARTRHLLNMMVRTQPAHRMYLTCPFLSQTPMSASTRTTAAV